MILCRRPAALALACVLAVLFVRGAVAGPKPTIPSPDDDDSPPRPTPLPGVAIPSPVSRYLKAAPGNRAYHKNAPYAISFSVIRKIGDKFVAWACTLQGALTVGGRGFFGSKSRSDLGLHLTPAVALYSVDTCRLKGVPPSGQASFIPVTQIMVAPGTGRIGIGTMSRSASANNATTSGGNKTVTGALPQNGTFLPPLPHIGSSLTPLPGFLFTKLPYLAPTTVGLNGSKPVTSGGVPANAGVGLVHSFAFFGGYGGRGQKSISNRFMILHVHRPRQYFLGVITASMFDGFDKFLAGKGARFDLRWEQPIIPGPKPPARYNHAAAQVGSYLFIHGGMGRKGYLDDLWVLDLRRVLGTKLPDEGARLNGTNTTKKIYWKRYRPLGPSAPPIHSHVASLITLITNEVFIIFTGGYTKGGLHDGVYVLSTGCTQDATFEMKFTCGRMPPGDKYLNETALPKIGLYTSQTTPTMVFEWVKLNITNTTTSATNASTPLGATSAGGAPASPLPVGGNNTARPQGVPEPTPAMVVGVAPGPMTGHAAFRIFSQSRNTVLLLGGYGSWYYENATARLHFNEVVANHSYSIENHRRKYLFTTYNHSYLEPAKPLLPLTAAHRLKCFTIKTDPKPRLQFEYSPFKDKVMHCRWLPLVVTQNSTGYLGGRSHFGYTVTPVGQVLVVGGIINPASKVFWRDELVHKCERFDRLSEPWLECEDNWTPPPPSTGNATYYTRTGAGLSFVGVGV